MRLRASKVEESCGGGVWGGGGRHGWGPAQKKYQEVQTAAWTGRSFCFQCARLVLRASGPVSRNQTGNPY